MRILFIFLLTICVVCSEEEESEEEITSVDYRVALQICDYYAKEELLENCTVCAVQTITEIKVKETEDDETMKKIIAAKTKEILAECSNYLSQSERSEECSKMDGLEFISCMRTVFPEAMKRGMSWRFCYNSDETDECEQCIFDSLKKSWEITFQTTEKIETKEEKAEMKKQLMETEATEMANNCNHLFRNKDNIKECANKEFGKRMECIGDMIYYRDLRNYVYELCSFTTEESKEEDCYKCGEELNGETAEDDRENYKKALEKCGEYIERQDELMECTNKEAEDVPSCLNDVFIKTLGKKLAVRMCMQKPTDECTECVSQSYQKALEAYQDMSKEEKNIDYVLEELEATDISTNCYQHFQKEEEIKNCGTKEYGERMECIRVVLHGESE